MRSDLWKLLLIVLLISGCTTKEKIKKADHLSIPREIEKGIKAEFPGAMPYSMAIDTLLGHLSKMDITADKILWGQSTCVDDITNTKNKLVHPEIKGPFTIGGLAGIPFTGITGIDAFAHHVPEDGAALIFVGPHIGFRDKDGWGKVLRHGQQHSSSCCGALYAALQKLQKGEITLKTPSQDDYQEQMIEQLALVHQKEILNAKEPLVMLTRVTFREAKNEILAYSKKVHERHFAYAVLVVGVIINTDYEYDDYLWIEHISVKDIKKNIWIKVK